MAASGEGSAVSRSKKWTFVGRRGKRSSKINYIELCPKEPKKVLAIQSGAIQGSSRLPNHEHAGGGSNSISRRMLRPASEVSTTPTRASTAHGFHPIATSAAPMRASYERKDLPFGNLFAGVSLRPKEKVIVHHKEKAFIRSLGDMDDRDWETLSASPPLLGSDRAQGYRRKTSPQVAARKKTLVVGLCETLVRIGRTPCICDYQIAFKVVNDQEAGCATVRDIPFYVSLRPGLTKFLEKASALYELVVWTASGKPLADAILDRLDPDGKYFSYRLYREACTRYEGLYIKDVRRLGRPMHSVVVLDNSVYSFGLTLDNGVPISPWTGNKTSAYFQEAEEYALNMAFSVLKKVARVPDVRVPLVAAFNLHETIHGVVK